MNIGLVVYLIFYAIGFVILLGRYVLGDGWIKITFWDVIVGPIITFTLLYMAGLFS